MMPGRLVEMSPSGESGNQPVRIWEGLLQAGLITMVIFHRFYGHCRRSQGWFTTTDGHPPPTVTVTNGHRDNGECDHGEMSDFAHQPTRSRYGRRILPSGNVSPRRLLTTESART